MNSSTIDKKIEKYKKLEDRPKIDKKTKKSLEILEFFVNLVHFRGLFVNFQLIFEIFL